MTTFFIIIAIVLLLVFAIALVAYNDEDCIVYYLNTSPKVLKERLRNVKRLVKSRRFKWIGKLGKTKLGDNYQTLKPINEATYLSRHHGGKGTSVYWVTIGESTYVPISIDGHILLESLNCNVNSTFLLVHNAIKNAIRFLDEEEDRDDDE